MLICPLTFTTLNSMFFPTILNTSQLTLHCWTVLHCYSFFVCLSFSSFSFRSFLSLLWGFGSRVGAKQRPHGIGFGRRSLGAARRGKEFHNTSGCISRHRSYRNCRRRQQKPQRRSQRHPRTSMLSPMATSLYIVIHGFTWLCLRVRNWKLKLKLWSADRVWYDLLYQEIEEWLV